MNKILGIALAITAATATATATAGAYVTGQGSYTNYNIDNASDLDSTYGGGIGVGYDINTWLAVEVTADHLGSDIDGGTKYQTRSLTGWIVADPTVAKVGKMPLKLIGRVGYAKTEFKYSGGEYNDNDPAYGVGVALGVTENVDVFVDYRRRTLDTNFDTFELKTANVGVKYSF